MIIAQHPKPESPYQQLTANELSEPDVQLYLNTERDRGLSEKAVTLMNDSGRIGSVAAPHALSSPVTSPTTSFIASG